MRLGMSAVSIMIPLLARMKGIAIIAVVLLLGLGMVTGTIPQAMRAVRADVDAWAANSQAEANEARIKEQASQGQLDMINQIINTPASEYRKRN